MEIIAIVAVIAVVAIALASKKKKKRGTSGSSSSQSGGKSTPSKELRRSSGNQLSSTLSQAKWFTVQDICLKYSEAQLKNYLDLMVKTGCNCVLLKSTGFLMNDDGLTWNMHWVEKYHWFIENCKARNIYVQISLMDFWNRGAKVSHGFIEGPGLYNWWDQSQPEKKKEYIKRHVEQFDRHWNVFWELGNEMGHGGADKAGFLAAAWNLYLPTFRQHSNRLIGVSEHDMWQLPVDILQGHNVAVIKTYDRPFFFNEIAGSSKAYEDRYIRDPSKINEYKGVINKCKEVGAVGCAAATWYDIRQPPNHAVMEVLNHLGGKF